MSHSNQHDRRREGDSDIDRTLSYIREDLTYVRQNMVTRAEFDLTAGEHSVFRADISELKAAQKGSSFQSKLVERGLVALVVLGLAAALGGFKWLLPL